MLTREKGLIMVTKRKLITAIAVTFVVTAVVVGIFTFSIVNVLQSQENNGVDNDVEAVSQVIQEMFYQPVDDEQLTKAAINGMVEYLDDPYTEYFDEEQWTAYLKDQQGEYTGIGVQVTYDEECAGILVTRVFSDSPAEEVGLKEGDFIISADGVTFENDDYDGIVQKIRGEPGTSVTVGLLRGDDELTFDIVRQIVIAEQAYYKMLDNNVGYFELYTFTGNALVMFRDAETYFKDNNAEALIIDLRNNLGGDLIQVTQMLDDLLPKGDLIITKNREGVESTIASDESMWDIPLVVLVNEYSASASELFSIAIQDYDRGPVIGDVTFGKGVVQTILPLGDGTTAFKLTTSEYFSPKGRSINKTGVTPDFEIVDEDITDDEDPVIDKALELLSVK